MKENESVVITYCYVNLAIKDKVYLLGMVYTSAFSCVKYNSNNR